MRRIESIIPVMVAGLAACGGAGERVSIRGDFVDTTAAAVPTEVVAVEGGQTAKVSRGAFELRELSAGPVTLRLVRGTDTIASLALQNVPAGAEIGLRGLETDGPTSRAFPRALDLNGPSVLVLNGIRMGRGEALPTQVDARGIVLATSNDRAALLVRPNDSWLPDLRVVTGLSTEIVTPDSARVEAASIGRGDSVRVEGRADQGFVVATRVIVWRGGRTAMRETSSARTESASSPDGSPSSGTSASNDGETSGSSSPETRRAEPARAAAPVAARSPAIGRREPARGKPGGGPGPRHGGGPGNGRGRGHGKKG